MPALEAYRRDLSYSYAPGVFPSMEAMQKRPELVRRLLISSRGQESDGVRKLCGKTVTLKMRMLDADLYSIKFE